MGGREGIIKKLIYKNTIRKNKKQTKEEQQIINT